MKLRQAFAVAASVVALSLPAAALANQTIVSEISAVHQPTISTVVKDGHASYCKVWEFGLKDTAFNKNWTITVESPAVRHENTYAAMDKKAVAESTLLKNSFNGQAAPPLITVTLKSSDKCGVSAPHLVTHAATYRHIHKVH